MSDDSVSRIHGRFYLTLINPSSHLTSLLISFICASIVVFLSYAYYLNLPLENLAVLPLSLGVLYAAKMIDYVLLRNAPVAKFTKIYHTAAFANILWSITIALGIATSFVLGRDTDVSVIVAGMLLAAGLRIGIFTSVFGTGLTRAILISPILPLLFFVSFIPLDNILAYISDPAGVGFGLTFMAISTVWSMTADRAGRPNVKSTFNLLQAYLLAWTEHNPKPMEVIMEDRARQSRVNTYTLSLNTPSGRSLIVLPDIHPGPFYPVGGSNLPYEIYRAYSANAIHAVVMHSVSDHSLNLPSRVQLESYLKSLDLQNQNLVEHGNTCTEPIAVQVNSARVSGIAFGKVAVLMLSLAPHGMEDVPEIIRKEVERYATSRGFSNVLVIDTHNSMGEHLSEEDSSDMLKVCRIVLDEMIMKPQHNFKFGFCHSSEIDARANDVGPAGMSVMMASVNGRSFAICWADANNMANGLREHIVEHLAANDVSVLEICTSDTHYTSGNARNITGYFTFGSLTKTDDASKWYLEMAERARGRLEHASYEAALASSEVKIMGTEQFSDYSNALDKALNVTKVSIGVTAAVYVAMLLLS
jgi:putative membrane protein